jgi:uncharacterized protein (DUF1501 family)
MKREPSLKTRREFLRSTMLGGAVAWTVPTFLANTFTALHLEAAEKGARAESGKDSTILVILQMAGGNDGLNTVVPFTNDHYHRARTRLALPEKAVLKLNDTLGLHPALGSLKHLYDAGHLSIVQGVGYPNSNRSHFRSTEIWQTASDANTFEKHGWLGRYFDNACDGCDATAGVIVGRQMPQAFASQRPVGICLDNPENYRFAAGRSAAAGDVEASFRQLNQPPGMMDFPDMDMDSGAGGTVQSIGGAARPAGSPLDFIERTALDAQVSSDRILAISRQGENRASYPGSQLASSLRLVARLIGGGLPTRVFYVSQGGYDTHTNQAGAHERLLREMGDAVKAFVEDLKAQGNMDRVLLMTFSEFGRRVRENANNGTDHGAAAPLFIVGSQVKAGLLGKAPSLAPADLHQGDLKFTTDFRSIYAGVLEEWLKTKSEPVLGRKFPALKMV